MNFLNRPPQVNEHNLFLLLFLLATPKKKMTPGKVHSILVPETPKRQRAPSGAGDGNNRNNRKKSDGTVMVKESPDVAAAKYGNPAAATPRTQRAKDRLFRKSFYDSDLVRRSIMIKYEFRGYS